MSIDSNAIDLKTYIRDIPNFPKPGIIFRDITPLLAHPGAFQSSIEQLAGHFTGQEIDLVVSAEARGFIFGAPLALSIGAGFVPIRKPGKLPYEKVGIDYDLEYGRDRLEMHADALLDARKVLLLDDVLATGGTMRACCDLVTRSGAEVVACAFLLELSGLGGRSRLAPFDVFSLIQY